MNTRPAQTYNSGSLRTILVLTASLLFLIPASGHSALVTVDSFYSGINAATGRTGTSVATFDDSSVTGIGVEKVQLETISFLFSHVGVPQVPTITPQTPDASGNYLQGTFLAIYDSGVFQHLTSEGGAGGFAQPPSAVTPGTAVGTWILLGPTGLRIRVGLTSSGFADYVLDSQIATGSVPPVPLPPAAWLFFTALIGLAGLGKRKRRA